MFKFIEKHYYSVCFFCARSHNYDTLGILKEHVTLFESEFIIVEMMLNLLICPYPV